MFRTVALDPTAAAATATVGLATSQAPEPGRLFPPQAGLVAAGVVIGLPPSTTLPSSAAALAGKAERELLKWLPQAQEYLACLARRELPGPHLVEAFGRFFAACHPLICEFAVAIGVSPNDVRDCAQNVWRDLLSALPLLHYDPRRAKLSSWLYAIVRNEAANLVHRVGLRTGRIGARAWAVPAPAGPDPLLELEQQVEQELLTGAMAELRRLVSKDNYQVLYLRLMQRFSIADTAEAMGKSADWVRAHSCRTTPMLKRIVERLDRERPAGGPP